MRNVIATIVAFMALLTPVNALDIWVSHSSYDLIIAEGEKVLFNCKVGLGSSEFPTPIGEYFITHIYDADPWWIPPVNRPWAYGKRPSKDVYGGTMAPLLKKKMPRTSFDGEDFIAMECELVDHDYRFHGTKEVFSIGLNQSHGCVRMLPKDAKQVADVIKQQVGICGHGQTPNGTFVILCRPVKLTIVR
jgi:lipoprotein-anchoring transpeptidase ErfK/SrfK